ncbi:MAG: diacylglycerol kinase family protein [Microgenomates group bacterium]
MIKKQIFSFKNALSGVKWVVSTQRNFKIHLFLSFLAITGGAFFQISYQEFLVILVLIFLGLALETVNTAIEETIDALHKEKSEEIRIAKDVAAAAMFIFAVGAFTIACIIFIPRISQFLISNF